MTETVEKFYAGFWVRLFAGMFDCLFLALPCLLLIYAFGNGEFESFKIENGAQSLEYLSATSYNSFANLITYGVGIAYAAYFLSSKKQATFGKRIMGIYVGNFDGSKLSASKAVARAASSILTAATLGLGFIIVIFTKEKISLHDFICKTRVFHGRKNV